MAQTTVRLAAPQVRLAAPAERLRAASPPAQEGPAARIEDLSVFYGAKQALKGITMTIPAHRVTAFIGPSGCGKTTLLRCLNRMNDLIEDIRIEGRIHIAG